MMAAPHCEFIQCHYALKIMKMVTCIYVFLYCYSNFRLTRGKETKQYSEKWRKPSFIMLVGPEKFGTPKV